MDYGGQTQPAPRLRLAKKEIIMKKLFLVVLIVLSTLFSGCQTSLGQKLDLTSPTSVTFNGRRTDEPPAPVIRTRAPLPMIRYQPVETHYFYGRWDSNPKAKGPGMY
jgi:hypothetical protein